MQASRRFSAIAAIAALASCLSCSTGDIGGVIGGLIIGKELDDLASTLQHTAAKAAQDGDFVVEKNAHMLGLLIRDAEHLLSGQLDKRFDQLSDENQKLISVIREAIQKLDELAGRTLDLEDFIVLDLQNLINQLPFKADKFLLRRIDGYSQNYQAEGVYDFRVIGNAFGPGFVSEATVNGIRVSPLDIKISKAHELYFSVPVSAINDAFQDDTVHRVPFKLVSRKTTNGKPLFAHSGQLLLLPKHPIKCVLKEIRKDTKQSSTLSWTEEVGRLVAKGETVSVRVKIPAGGKLATVPGKDERFRDAKQFVNEVRTDIAHIERDKLRELDQFREQWKKEVRWDDKKNRETVPETVTARVLRAKYTRLADTLREHRWHSNFFEISGDESLVSRKFTNMLQDTTAYMKVGYYKIETQIVESEIGFDRTTSGRLPFGTSFANLSENYQSYTASLTWFNGKEVVLSPTNEAIGTVRATLEGKTQLHRLRIDVSWPR